MALYDLSWPLMPGLPVWPGDHPIRWNWTLRRAQGASVNLGAVATTTHAGAHADAPLHVDDAGAPIDALDLEAYWGEAYLADAPPDGRLDDAWAARLLADDPPRRLLVRTGCWRDERTFPTDFPTLTPAAAARLAAAGLRLYGTDAPSVDAFHSVDLPVHRALLGAGVAVLENLRLAGVPPGRYELVALPLRLVGADASPVRAVLRPLAG
jgi:arylformamidase